MFLFGSKKSNSNKNKKYSTEILTEFKPVKQPLFGMSLETAARLTDVNGGFVPQIVRDCIDYLNTYSLNEEGLYRISGSVKVVGEWVTRLNNGERLNFIEMRQQQKESIFTPNVCKLLLNYFKSLPEHILTERVIDEFNVYRNFNTVDKLEALRKLLSGIPLANRHTLKLFMEHLQKIAAKSEINHMGKENLLICVCGSSQATSIYFLLFDYLDELLGEQDFVLPDYGMSSTVVADQPFTTSDAVVDHGFNEDRSQLDKVAGRSNRQKGQQRQPTSLLELQKQLSTKHNLREGGDDDNQLSDKEGNDVNILHVSNSNIEIQEELGTSFQPLQPLGRITSNAMHQNGLPDTVVVNEINLERDVEDEVDVDGNDFQMEMGIKTKPDSGDTGSQLAQSHNHSHGGMSNKSGLDITNKSNPTIKKSNKNVIKLKDTENMLAAIRDAIDLGDDAIGGGGGRDDKNSVFATATDGKELTLDDFLRVSNGLLDKSHQLQVNYQTDDGHEILKAKIDEWIETVKRHPDSLKEYMEKLQSEIVPVIDVLETRQRQRIENANTKITDLHTDQVEVDAVDTYGADSDEQEGDYDYWKLIFELREGIVSLLQQLPQRSKDSFLSDLDRKYVATARKQYQEYRQTHNPEDAEKRRNQGILSNQSSTCRLKNRMKEISLIIAKMSLSVLYSASGMVQRAQTSKNTFFVSNEELLQQLDDLRLFCDTKVFQLSKLYKEVHQMTDAAIAEAVQNTIHDVQREMDNILETYKDLFKLRIQTMLENCDSEVFWVKKGISERYKVIKLLTKIWKKYVISEERRQILFQFDNDDLMPENARLNGEEDRANYGNDFINSDNSITLKDLCRIVQSFEAKYSKFNKRF